MATTKTGRTFFALGTINTIQAFGKDSERAADAAVDRVLQIHGRMSAFLKGSDIFYLNAAAGIKAVQVHPDTMSLLLLAAKYARITKGAFDITLHPLSLLWSVGKRGDFIPSKGHIKKALGLTGIKDLIINPEDSSARLSRPGQSVDLGGIAKGYAGDEVKRILLKHGIQNALVNLGGNIVALGANPKEKPWRVGIQNPLRTRGESLMTLSIKNRSLVTSGMGERFFLKDGRFFHHILDPKTGTPAQNGLLSVTVASPSGADADALATALFVLGPEKGLPLLSKIFQGFPDEARPEVLFIKEDQSVPATPNLSHPAFKLTEEL